METVLSRGKKLIPNVLYGALQFDRKTVLQRVRILVFIHYLLFFLKGVLAGYSQDAYQSPQKKELCLALTISFTTGEILSPTFYTKTHETNFFKEILVYYQVRKPGTKMRIF